MVSSEDDTIYVSARSYGDISVQIILEKIGGGGHIGAAAAQFFKEEYTFEMVEEMLIKAIDVNIWKTNSSVL